MHIRYKTHKIGTIEPNKLTIDGKSIDLYDIKKNIKVARQNGFFI